MSKNILIAGIGGQGVNTLSIAIQNACIKEGYYCKSSIFKGGAQKRGGIFSFIRIFEEKNEEVANFSGEIGSKELDVMISLEYWESIRYLKYYNINTNILVNQKEITFFSKRYKEELIEINPEEVLKKSFENLIMKDFSKVSIDFFGVEKMMNFIIGIEAIKRGLLPVRKSILIEEFRKKINFTDELLIKMKSYVDA